MLAANVCTADFLERHQPPGALPRARGPDAGEARGAARFPRELRAGAARAATARRRPTTRSFCSGSRIDPDYALLQTVLLRSLQQAQYRPDNVGHFGLSYEAYAHFTSPIRRYPDLLVHRAIKAVLAGTQYKPGGASWAELGAHCSLTERRADDATRDVEKLAQVLLHAGQGRRDVRRHDQRRHELRDLRHARRAQRSTASST